MKTRLEDVIAANSLLVSLGAEDQMPRLAAASIERALTLQDRLDRALAYAASTPPNSAHARQMARILDGSITREDEEAERNEQEPASPGLFPAAPDTRRHLEAPRPKPAKPASGKRGGLAGRSTAQRRAFREWIADQGIELGMQGPVPHHLVEQYDAAMEALRQARAEERRKKSA